MGPAVSPDALPYAPGLFEGNRPALQGEKETNMKHRMELCIFVPIVLNDVYDATSRVVSSGGRPLPNSPGRQRIRQLQCAGCRLAARTQAFKECV